MRYTGPGNCSSPFDVVPPILKTNINKGFWLYAREDVFERTQTTKKLQRGLVVARYRMMDSGQKSKRTIMISQETK